MHKSQRRVMACACAPHCEDMQAYRSEGLTIYKCSDLLSDVLEEPGGDSLGRIRLRRKLRLRRRWRGRQNGVARQRPRWQLYFYGQGRVKVLAPGPELLMPMPAPNELVEF